MEENKDLFEQFADDPLFLKQITDSGPAITYVLDLERNDFIYINISANDLSGNDKSYFFMQGRNIFREIVHPNDYERTILYIDLLSKDDQRHPHVLEARLRIKDNYYRWFRFSDHIFKRNEQGRPIRSIGVAQDIHEAKLAGQESEKLNSWFNSVLEQSPNGITALRAVRDKRGAIADLEYIFANRAATDAIRKGDLAGTLFCKDLPSIKRSGLFERYVEVIETGQHWEDEIYYSDDEQVEAWLHVSVTKLDDGCIATFFDVSGRKRIEEQIAKQEKQYHSLVENTPDVICRWDKDLRLVFANAATEKKMGASKESLYGKTNIEMGQSADIARPWMERLQRAFETGNQVTYMNTYPTPDGLSHFFTRIVPEKNAQGEVETVLTIARDITEMKKAEQEVLSLKDQLSQKATDRYQTLFNSINEGFCIIEKLHTEGPLDFRFIEANPAFAIHTGASNVVGKTIREAFPQESEEWFLIYDHVVTTGREIRFERAMDSHDTTLELYAFRVNDETMRRVAVVFRDVTERKRAERKLKESKDLVESIAETIPDMVSVQELSSRKIIYSNREPFSLNGFNADDLAKMTVDERHALVHPDDIDGLVSHIESLSHMTDGQVATHEYRAKHKTEDWVWLRVRSKVFERDETGKVKSIANVIQNISEQKKAAEKLNANGELLQSIIDASLSTIRVMSAVRHQSGEIVDFRYVLSSGPTGQPSDRVGKLFSQVHPELVDSDLFRHFKNVIETGARADFEVRASQDGVAKWFRVVVVKLGEEIVSAAEDISERKHREINAAFLVDLRDSIALLSSEEEILLAAGIKIGRFLEIAACVLVYVNEQLNKATPCYLWTSAGIPRAPESVRISDFVIEESTRLLRGGNTIVVRDIETDSLFHAGAHRPLQVRSSINVPFHRHGEWKFLFCATDTRPRNWREDEVDLFREFANRVSLRIEQARAEAAARTARESYLSQLEKKVDESTREAERNRQLLESMSESTPNLLAFFDTIYSEKGDIEDFVLLLCNKKTALTLGHNSAELVGMKYSSLFPAAVTNGAFARVKEVARKGVPADFQLWYSTHNTEQWFHCTVSKLNHIIVLSAEIITDRKKVEREQLKALALLQQAEALAKSGNWEFNTSTEEFSVSDGMYHLFGIDRNVAITPDVFVDAAVKDHKDKARTMVKLLKNNFHPFEESLTINVAGTRKTIRTTADFGRSGDKRNTVVGISIDITEKSPVSLHVDA